MSVDAGKFQAYIYRFFDLAGRNHLPWRQDFQPYKIMVSEVMLQQTQVDRVIPKFEAFMAAFPTVEDLANAKVAEVIRQWQGLGYNRRGLNLQKAAQKIMLDFGGQVPEKFDDLLSLPGIGPYTAAAIQAFAFNQPSLVIETNIRTAYIFHFFHGAYKVDDRELLDLIAQTVDTENPRKWYSALMDYGSFLKQHVPNPTRLSKTYVKQSKFEGSNRKIRGGILKELGLVNTLSEAKLAEKLNTPLERVQVLLTQLQAEGFILKDGAEFRLNDLT